MPTTSAERLLVSIDLRSMAVYDEDGNDVCLRMINGHHPDIQENCVFVDGKLHKTEGFELYCELLTFWATPVVGGSRYE